MQVQTIVKKLNRRWRHTSVAVVAATGIALAVAPGAPADVEAQGWESLPTSYRSPSPYDAGGYDASVRLMLNGSGQNSYGAWFHAYDERLEVSDNYTDGRRAQAEVRVYRRADAHGIPYDMVDRDTQLFTGSSWVFNLGTPDGTGDIPEGYWIAIRVRPEGTSYWSEWAYGRA